MSSIEELLGIGKKASEVKEVKEVTPTPTPTPTPAPLSGLAATLAQSKLAMAEKTLQIQQKKESEEIAAETPMQLAPASSAVSSSTPSQSVPTIEDVSNFVFDEQSDSLDSDLVDEFRTKLQSLSTATNADIPTCLSECLLFIKEHAFIADILKPEHRAELTMGLRKSYGYVIQNKVKNSTKKAESNKKVDKALDAMAGLNF